MQIIDTSSIVHAWDNYPIQQFPTLWHWLGQQFACGDLCLPEVAFAEVLQVAPGCHAWLQANGAVALPVTNAILLDALRIKHLLHIGPHYAGGVGANDLLIIATARFHGAALITNEAKRGKKTCRSRWQITRFPRCADFVTSTSRAATSSTS